MMWGRGEQQVRERLKDGMKVPTYIWEHVTIGEKHEECFMSGKPLRAGARAYRGYNRIEGPQHWPSVLWLTEGEFTILKLKGQI